MSDKKREWRDPAIRIAGSTAEGRQCGNWQYWYWYGVSSSPRGDAMWRPNRGTANSLGEDALRNATLEATYRHEGNVCCHFMTVLHSSDVICSCTSHRGFGYKKYGIRKSLLKIRDSVALSVLTQNGYQQLWQVNVFWGDLSKW
jgi:hypothetical protein